MNRFQSQLLMNGKTLAEIAKKEGWKGFELPIQPSPISIEDFELLMKQSTWDDDEEDVETTNNGENEDTHSEDWGDTEYDEDDKYDDDERDD